MENYKLEFDIKRSWIKINDYTRFKRSSVSFYSISIIKSFERYKLTTIVIIDGSKEKFSIAVTKKEDAEKLKREAIMKWDHIILGTKIPDNIDNNSFPNEIL